MAVFETVSQYLLFTRDVNHHYERLLAGAAEACGLTKPEGDVLLFLANSPQLDTARDACEYRGFSKAYVSKAVDALVGRGFLHITPDGQDRRVQHLRIQPVAQGAVERLRQAQKQFFDQLTAGLTPQEEKMLWCIMERMHSNIVSAVP